MTAPLMPKATAVWLVENTTLTFRQISKFCEIHELEIQAIADGDIAANIVGRNPVHSGILTLAEIERCQKDPAADLVANELENNVKERNAKSKRLLSPTQRSEKPAAVLWILKNCPEIMDSQICKLIGTTKPTINKIRNGEYDSEIELKPKNPVTIGLCDEKDLESALAISKIHNQPKKKKSKAKKKTKKATAKKVKTTKTAAKKTTAKKKTATKKAPAKKATTKKAVAKKTTAVKKTATKKATVKKTATKKAPAKKTATKKTVAKKTTAVKKTATKKAAVKKTATKKAPAKKVATKKAPAKKVATKKAKKSSK